MFIGREKELGQLNAELSSWKRKTAVLVYGKRRVGKSTLLSEAAKGFDGVVINHMCVTSTFEGNLELIYQSVSEGLGLPNIRFGSLFEVMDYLKTLDKKILLIIDEYTLTIAIGDSGQRVIAIFHNILLAAVLKQKTLRYVRRAHA